MEQATAARVHMAQSSCLLWIVKFLGSGEGMGRLVCTLLFMKKAGGRTMGIDFGQGWDADSGELPQWGEDEYQGGLAAEENFLEGEEPAKKSMTIFFLIDISGSMSGTKIGTVNSTMEELLPELVGIGGSSTEIKVAVMTFSSKAQWINPGPVRAEEWEYWDRLGTDTITEMGAAFEELNRKLSRGGFLNSPSLSYAPVIFLMSDGGPTDDYRKGLLQLKHNNWFRHGLKIAMAIGGKVNMQVLEEFTGNPDLVVQALNANQLKALVKTLSITSAQIGSKSMELSNDGREKTEQDVIGSKQRDLAKEALRLKEDLMAYDGSSIDQMELEAGW